MIEKQITVVSIIKKIRTISDEKYEGKVYDNIMPIFNKLTTEEKRLLLKGLMNICFILEDKILIPSESLDEVKTMVNDNKNTIQSEIENIEQFNQRELIRLKTWLVKAIITATIGSFILFSMTVIVFGNEKGTVLTMFENLIKLLKIIIGG